MRTSDTKKNTGTGISQTSSDTSQRPTEEQSQNFQFIHRMIQKIPQKLSPHIIRRMQQLHGNAQTKRLIQTARKDTIQRGLDELIKNQTKLKGTDLFYKEKMTLETARDLMQRLAAGDQSVLNELKVLTNEVEIGNAFDSFDDDTFSLSESEPVYKPADEKKAKIVGENFLKDKAVEWGLMQDPKTQEVAIFRGDKTSTDWEIFLDAGLTPLAHTHPHENRKIGENKNNTAWELDEVLEDKTKRLLVFPSGGDIFLQGKKMLNSIQFLPPTMRLKVKTTILLQIRGALKAN